nr:amidohydrolase [Tissierella sp.]
MRTILKNAKFFVEKGVFKEATLIQDGFIKKVGTNDDFLKEDADRVIDLQGRTVLPGLNDSHLHLSLMGEFMSMCDLTPARSIEEIITIGREFIKANPKIRILKGRGWNQDYFTKGDIRNLNRHDLDKISCDIPIIFERVCLHLASSNSKAIELLNLEENPKVIGGIIELGEDNLPNGIFKEYAVKLIKSITPKKQDQEIEEEILKAMEYCISQGITSVGSCDIMNNDYQQIFRVIHKIYREKKTSLRYSHQFNFQNLEDFKEYLGTEFKNKDYDDVFLSRGSLKLFKDGSLGARTALLKEAYRDDPSTKGLDSLDDKTLKSLVELAHKNKIQVLTHAIGDGAIESLIDIYSKVNSKKKNKYRHSIVHCQITTKEQIQRISDEELSVLVQPIFLDYDIQIAASRVGEVLAETSYAFNSLYNSKARLSLSSDSPIEAADPFPNIHCAVNRSRLDGPLEKDFSPKEKMNIESAIDAYTAGSAFNEFKEDRKGKLREGFFADLIVIDRDIFSIDPLEIKDIKVEKTMIYGQFVFER